MKHLFIIVIALFSLNLPAAAEIYQVTDEKGNKVFTNIEPKQSEGKTIQKVDVKETNTTLGDAINNDDYFEQQQLERQQREERRAQHEQQQRQARRAVREAEQELEQAKELQSGDYFNIPGKGMRYKDSYHQRVKQAEEKLQQAKKQLQSVQQGLPPSDEQPY